VHFLLGHHFGVHVDNIALHFVVCATVFRKLSTLPYRSSYSHCGAYYTLDSIAQFSAERRRAG